MDLYNLVVSAKLSKGGGGGDIDVDELSVTENGTYTAEEGHAYSPVTVEVPNSYSASDEGKVVSNGALVGQTSATKTANGTYDTTANNEVVVAVPQPSGNVNITSTAQTDVSAYATAQVVDADLVAGNIKKDVDILGVVGTYEGGGGGGSVPKKDVNFYDYDGTVVASYSASDFANLSAMPSNPSHTGLTAQGWNWSLADAKTYVAKYGALNIGQMYITTSGDTEIDIELHDGRLEPILGIAPNGTVEIDWGDGSAKDTVTGTSLTTNKDTQHIYASEGSYTIKLHVVSGSFAIYGDSTRGSQLLHKTGVTTNEWRVYQNAIQAVRIGDNTSIGVYAFSNCSSLISVTIPDGVTSIGNYAFRSCYSLISVTIPDDLTSIGSYTFNNCFLLASIIIPDGVTSIGSYAFQGCYLLTSITTPDDLTSIGSYTFNNCFSLTFVTIPDNVMSIDSNAFQGCSGVKRIDFLPTTPPAVYDANAFNNLSLDIVVYVPNGTLEAYQAEASYTNIASKMVERAA